MQSQTGDLLLIARCSAANVGQTTKDDGLPHGQIHSLAAQRGYGVDYGGAAGGDITCQQGD
jgi:hypothetical protein